MNTDARKSDWYNWSPNKVWKSLKSASADFLAYELQATESQT
jgi:hypothetical protein